MERTGVRELRQNASVYLRRVASGETIEVADRGRLVARLHPAGTHLRDLGDPLPLPAGTEPPTERLARMMSAARALGLPLVLPG